MLGVTPATINDWLTQRRKIPSERIEQLANLNIFKGIPKDYFGRRLEQFEKIELDSIKTIMECGLTYKEGVFVDKDGNIDPSNDFIESNQAKVEFLKTIKRIQDIPFTKWGKDHEERKKLMRENILTVKMFAEIQESKLISREYFLKVLYAILLYIDQNKDRAENLDEIDDSQALQLVELFRKHNETIPNIINASLPIEEATHWVPLDEMKFSGHITEGKEYEIKINENNNEYYIIDDKGEYSLWFLSVEGYFINRGSNFHKYDMKP